MGAVGVDQADRSVGVAEGYEVFAEQPHAHRRAVGVGELFGEARRQPVTPQRFAHRRAGADTRDPEVLLVREHTVTLR